MAEISAVVTPCMAEYSHDYPAVYALALLPVYDAIARMKVHRHWQSDVVLGAAVVMGFGLYAYHRKTPFFMSVMPGSGALFGYRKAF